MFFSPTAELPESSMQNDTKDLEKVTNANSLAKRAHLETLTLHFWFVRGEHWFKGLSCSH